MSKLALPMPSNYYDYIAKDYDFLFTDSLSIAENRIVESDLSNVIASIGKPKITILDLGCGTGLGFSLIAKLSTDLNFQFEYVGVDISQKMIQIAENKYQFKNTSFICADMGNLPEYFSTKKFDLIVSLFGSFSHAENAGSLMGTLINSLLNKKGKLYLMTYSRFSIKNFYSAIKSANISKLSEKQPYNIRNSQSELFCSAFFYTPNKMLKIVKKILPQSKIQFKTINGFFEIPLLKKAVKTLSSRKVFAILKIERILLIITPFLGHSLITIIEKNPHENYDI